MYRRYKYSKDVIEMFDIVKKENEKKSLLNGSVPPLESFETGGQPEEVHYSDFDKRLIRRARWEMIIFAGFLIACIAAFIFV